MMELCSGGDLYHQLEKHGRYSESQAKVLFRHLMQVVLYCHDNGRVHRDLKPENILLATKATSFPIKLANFGLATYIKPGQSLRGTVGSPFYIAPEVLSGGYTQAADVWSTGVILYILLSGMPPFWGKTKSRIFTAVRAAELHFPSEPWNSISECAKELIRKMLCVDPLKRLTAEQVLAHLWIGEASSPSHDSHDNEVLCSRHSEAHEGSVSISFTARDQDIRFGIGPAGICEPQSPSFTCRSSFTTFLVEPSTPSLISDGSSFHSSGRSSTVEFASPVPSMPCFTFFSPGLVSEQVSHAASFSGTMTSTHATLTGAELEKPFISANCSPSSGNDARDVKVRLPDSKRTGGTNLRTMGTESVIQWPSYAHLSTASSLRASLVC